MSKPDSTEREAAIERMARTIERRREDGPSPTSKLLARITYDAAGWDARDAAVRELVAAGELALELIEGLDVRMLREEEQEIVADLGRALKPFVSPSEEVAR